MSKFRFRIYSYRKRRAHRAKNLKSSKLTNYRADGPENRPRHSPKSTKLNSAIKTISLKFKFLRGFAFFALFTVDGLGTFSLRTSHINTIMVR